MKDLAVVRNLALAVCIIGLFFACGCNPSKKAADVDPELQRRLDEYDQMMEEREMALIHKRRPANVVPASTANGEIPPVDLSAYQTDIAADSTAQPGAANLLPNIDQVASVPKSSISDLGSGAQYQTSTAIDLAGRLSRNSSPNEVCEAFLAALKDSDHISASQMLTNVAQLETARANLVLESPGTPESIIQLLPAKYATTEKKVAQVECLLSLPDHPTEVVHLTWMMRYQYNGWKISGMSIQLDQNSNGDLLSFENPRDLARIQQSVEIETTDELQAPAEMASSKGQDDALKR